MERKVINLKKAKLKEDIDIVLKNVIKNTVMEGLEYEISIEDIKDNTDLINDLGFHSIVSIRFIVAIEETLNIEIDDDILEKELLMNYSKLRDYLYNVL